MSRNTNRKLPKHEITSILQREVACLPQAFAYVASFSNFAPCLVLLLLSTAHLAEA